MSNLSLNVLSPGILGESVEPEAVADGRFGFVKQEHAEFPPIIIMAVTNVCDMACIHCAHPVIKKSAGYKGVFMDPAIHTRVVEETSAYKDRLWVFRYAADGESLLHPNFSTSWTRPRTPASARST